MKFFYFLIVVLLFLGCSKNTSAEPFQFSADFNLPDQISKGFLNTAENVGNTANHFIDRFTNAANRTLFNTRRVTKSLIQNAGNVFTNFTQTFMNSTKTNIEKFNNLTNSLNNTIENTKGLLIKSFSRQFYNDANLLQSQYQNALNEINEKYNQRGQEINEKLQNQTRELNTWAENYRQQRLNQTSNGNETANLQNALNNFKSQSETLFNYCSQTFITPLKNLREEAEQSFDSNLSKLDGVISAVQNCLTNYDLNLLRFSTCFNNARRDMPGIRIGLLSINRIRGEFNLRNLVGLTSSQCWNDISQYTETNKQNIKDQFGEDQQS